MSLAHALKLEFNVVVINDVIKDMEEDGESKLEWRVMTKENEK